MNQRLEEIANSAKKSLTNTIKAVAATSLIYGAGCAPATGVQSAAQRAPYECDVNVWFKPDMGTYDIDISHPAASEAVWNVRYTEGNRRHVVFENALESKAYQSGFKEGQEFTVTGRSPVGNCYAEFEIGQ